jgi:hypothetical protein
VRAEAKKFRVGLCLPFPIPATTSREAAHTNRRNFLSLAFPFRQASSLPASVVVNHRFASTAGGWIASL